VSINTATIGGSLYNTTLRMDGNGDAERLIRTVARAFYTDSIVVVLDAFIREPFIPLEEIGPRLKMDKFEVDKVITELQQEWLIKCQELPAEVYRELSGATNVAEKKVCKLYYIDYRHFVNVIRYRVYLMRKSAQIESVKRGEELKKCPNPTCQKKYPVVEAMKYQCKNGHFTCYACNPAHEIKQECCEPIYRLVPFDDSEGKSAVESLQMKMDEQLKESADHDGIEDLLKNLEGKSLKENTPSENMRRHLTISMIGDEEALAVRADSDYFGGAADSRKRKHEDDQLSEHRLHENKTAEIIYAPESKEALPSFITSTDVRESIGIVGDRSNTNSYFQEPSIPASIKEDPTPVGTNDDDDDDEPKDWDET